ISTIVGYGLALEGCLEAGDLPGVRDGMTTILSSVRRLSAVLDDLLTLEMLRSGALTVAPRQVDVSWLVWRSVSGASKQAGERGVLVESVVEDDLPHALLDPDRVGQAL